MPPVRPENYQPGVAKQDMVVDWNHIIAAPDMPDDHYFNTNLNQIRLDEIRDVTAANFDLEVWHEVESPPSTSIRLTGKVLKNPRFRFDIDQTRSHGERRILRGETKIELLSPCGGGGGGGGIECKLTLSRSRPFPR